MKHSTLALLVGGVFPAVCLGISGVLQKSSAKAGIATGPYLVVAGSMLALMGGVAMLIERDVEINPRSTFLAALFGLFWSLGVASIAIAIRRFNGQISELVPLYNMNTLVAVAIGLFLMGEWKTVDVPRIFIASLLIIIGGVLAATSQR